MIRHNWDAHFIELATVIATRATCTRKHVAAILTRDNTILSTGYNGSPRGQPHCIDVGCEMEDGHCVRTVHAEANAITQAAKNGVNIHGATLYTTASPCYQCAKMLANAGIARVVFGEWYRPDERCLRLFQNMGIEVTVPMTEAA
jgi:dCMP deaminase